MRDGTAMSRHEAGFTLLELLIGLALLSLLTLTLYESISTGTRVWAASEATTASADDVRAAQQQLSRMISAAYPKVVMQDATHASIAFDGERESLMVLTPDPDLRGGFAYAIISTRQTETGKDLALTRKSELAASPRTTARVLLRGLAAFEFRYYGAEKENDAPAWHERWKNQMSPPKLVRVRATFADRRLSWPDLIVRPRIEGDVSCTFDALSKTCQGS